MKLLLSILFCLSCSAQFVDTQPTLAQAIGVEQFQTILIAWHVDWPSTNNYNLLVGTNFGDYFASIPLQGTTCQTLYAQIQPVGVLYLAVVATNNLAVSLPSEELVITNL